MNEMLGNHYFLTKRFKEAIPLYETVLEDKPDQILIKKKLIICLLKEGNIKEAVKHFSEILNEEVDQIISIQKDEDDCICKQMIYELENNPTSLSEIEKAKVLGILWLFCNSLTSLKYFEAINGEFKKEPIYKDLLNRIKHTFTHN